jgi:hypothetical protein
VAEDKEIELIPWAAARSGLLGGQGRRDFVSLLLKKHAPGDQQELVIGNAEDVLLHNHRPVVRRKQTPNVRSLSSHVRRRGT